MIAKPITERFNEYADATVKELGGLMSLPPLR